jgi:hypothetical protein
MDKLTKRRLSILKELMERQELAKSTIQKRKRRKREKKARNFLKRLRNFFIPADWIHSAIPQRLTYYRIHPF